VSSDDSFDPDKFSQNLHGRVHADIHERIRTRQMRGCDGRTRLLPGLVLVAIGTIILLDHMGILSIDHVWKFWPVILIVVGAMRFLESHNRVFGVLLIALGGLFLLGTLGYLRLTAADLWPIVLIAIGLGLIWSRFELPRIAMPLGPTGPVAPNKVNATALFGGVERRITTTNFTGGVVTAMFGGVELDFRAADIEGEEAVLFLEATFGGIELVVPERWTVIYEGQSIFGGYNDETRPPLPDVPGTAARKRLVLRGQALFGGITVKN
jgi:predicted membrane protein